MASNTATPTPSHPALNEADQAYLDATPWGDCRSLTVCGRTFTVDRRWLTQVAPPLVDPTNPLPFEIEVADTASSDRLVAPETLRESMIQSWFGGTQQPGPVPFG